MLNVLTLFSHQLIPFSEFACAQMKHICITNNLLQQGYRCLGDLCREDASPNFFNGLFWYVDGAQVVGSFLGAFVFVIIWVVRKISHVVEPHGRNYYEKIFIGKL